MGKYGKLSQQAPPPPRPWSVHPIWRGIGCLMVIILPILAFSGAHIVLDMNLEEGWFAVPPELSAPFTLPETNYTLDHFIGDLLVAVVFLLIGFALIMSRLLGHLQNYGAAPLWAGGRAAEIREGQYAHAVER